MNKCSFCNQPITKEEETKINGYRLHKGKCDSEKNIRFFSSIVFRDISNII